MKYLIISLTLCVAALFGLSACSKTPTNLGLKDGHFAPCPETNNCVSSEATDLEHAIAPIQATGNPDTVIIRLSNAIEFMFGSEIIEINETYIHAEYTSRVFRFVDDLECYYNKSKGVIEVRSGSRIGYSDFDANRDRVEELRTIFYDK